MKFLFLYSTVDGQSKKISERIAENVEKMGNEVVVRNISEQATIDLSEFDKIVLGASIRYGWFSRACYRFVRQNRAILDEKDSYFFGINLIARDEAKTKIERNVYVRKFFQKVDWQPKEIAIFAGKLDYPKYNFLDKYLIRLIMTITKGETDTSKTIEYTNWAAVDQFSQVVSQKA